MSAAVAETPCQSVPTWLLEKTFAVQYNPNCPKPWLVRLVGFKSGSLDMKPYQRGETHDAIGFGRTCEEAALAAQAQVDADRADFQAALANRITWRRPSQATADTTATPLQTSQA